MRDIEFRIWDEVNKKMVYNPFINFLYSVSTDLNVFIAQIEDKYNSSLMQYTGVVDKNGNKIYEGDIIIIPAYYEDYVRLASPGKVAYKENMFVVEDIRTGYTEIKSDLYQYEVVGNIYENPELMN